LLPIPVIVYLRALLKLRGTRCPSRQSIIILLPAVVVVVVAVVAVEGEAVTNQTYLQLATSQRDNYFNFNININPSLNWLSRNSNWDGGRVASLAQGGGGLQEQQVEVITSHSFLP
jgi:hypothetical protein